MENDDEVIDENEHLCVIMPIHYHLEKAQVIEFNEQVCRQLISLHTLCESLKYHQHIVGMSSPPMIPKSLCKYKMPK